MNRQWNWLAATHRHGCSRASSSASRGDHHTCGRRYCCSKVRTGGTERTELRTEGNTFCDSRPHRTFSVLLPSNRRAIYCSTVGGAGLTKINEGGLAASPLKRLEKSVMRHLFGASDLPTDVEPDELISEDTPEGYETVAGWWATREEAALEMLDDPIATLFADEELIITLADKSGILWKWCTAPAAFRRMGFRVSKSFPLELMQQFYPLNP